MTTFFIQSGMAVEGLWRAHLREGFGRALGGLWEGFGRTLGGLWEGSERALRGLWKNFGMALG